MAQLNFGMKRPDWQTTGAEPDYRFSLANERTFLAWIRTALAVLAGGIFLDQFAGGFQPQFALAGVAVALVFLSAVLAASAYFRWKGNEIAMRHSSPLPATIGIPLLSVAVASIAIAFSVLLVLRWL